VRNSLPAKLVWEANSISLLQVVRSALPKCGKFGEASESYLRKQVETFEECINA